MQDEELDKIVREAASQHHPPYDDSAWDKMEALLDQHLPQQKSRRRPVFWLLLAVLTAGGLFYTLVYPGITTGRTGKEEVAQQQKNNDAYVNAPVTTNDRPGTATPGNGNDNTITANNTITTSDQPVAQTASQVPVNSSTGNKTALSVNNASTTRPHQPALVKTLAVENQDVSTSNKIRVSRKAKATMRIQSATPQTDAAANVAVNEKNKKPSVSKQAATQNEEPEEELPVVAKTGTLVTATNEKDLVKTDTEEKKKVTGLTDKQEPEKKKEQPQPAKKSEEKTKKGFAANFGITASAGTDISYVNLGNPGKATFTYGAGLSYAAGKHLMVRSGFYVSKKVYAADPSEYGGTIYPYLTKIDGDCKVYEIPVSVSYNFGEKKKHNFFAGTGLSSFFMKKEYYNYTYKAPGGSVYYYDKTVDNKNKHVLSVLTFSGGYRYNVSRQVSLMAEPYVKLPLSGIGEGKIKLNSTGVLLTATVKPFAKKKPK